MKQQQLSYSSIINFPSTVIKSDKLILFCWALYFDQDSTARKFSFYTFLYHKSLLFEVKGFELEVKYVKKRKGKQEELVKGFEKQLVFTKITISFFFLSWVMTSRCKIFL